MNRSAQYVLLLAVALSAATAGFFLSSQLKSGKVDTSALMAAALPDVSGAPRTLQDWRGKLLVVNFWATWCPPCLEEIPIFIDLQSRLGVRGLQFVGIAVDDAPSVREFARAKGINYPLLVGQTGAIELSRAAGNLQGGLPYTVVLDQRGRLLGRFHGAVQPTELERLLLTHL
ncbi:MAG TPA: TlpA disulfide reductase family protein [Burkholderiales bacterium]|nr:TlpA disulfide reductase family protein [Burkholderiales bacterium]